MLLLKHLMENKNMTTKSMQLVDVEIIPPADDPLVYATVQGLTDNYIITLVDGIFHCSCADFNYRGEFPAFLEDKFKGNHQNEQYCCKHIKLLISYLKNKGVLK